MVTIARDWNGADYDRLSTPMEAMGLEVLARLELSGDETVVDAGCGSGRVTQALLERLPRGRVIGVDGSASMIGAARERLGDDPRLTLVCADLTALEPHEHLGGVRVDAILSTATFHWISDHALLFGRLRAALADGGRLIAQCGGAGNIASIHEAAGEAAALEPFSEHFAGWAGPWRFAGPDETERLLRGAGFGAARACLEPRPVEPPEPRAYLREINLGAHLEQLPSHLHEPFLDTVIARVARSDGSVQIDYVRLNIDAAA
jgi:trans-aconitate 2-methyltransferase